MPILWEDPEVRLPGSASPCPGPGVLALRRDDERSPATQTYYSTSHREVGEQGLPRLEKPMPANGTVFMTRPWEPHVVYERPRNHKAEGCDLPDAESRSRWVCVSQAALATSRRRRERVTYVKWRLLNAVDSMRRATL